MSKLNNLIGFWNSKSLEQEVPKSSSPKPTRPKSEIIDRNFVKRMENVGEAQPHRQRGGVSFLLRKNLSTSSSDIPAKSVGSLQLPNNQIVH